VGSVNPEEEISWQKFTNVLREWSDVPIIVISARDQEKDKVRTLDAGADDYLTKPFGAGELLARIRVALRHRAMKAAGQQRSVFIAGDLRVDLLKRQLLGSWSPGSGCKSLFRPWSGVSPLR
jgi:DNA-binding response OmpR family regulator